MSLFLNVPYSEKDEAKDLGARWNPTKKKWYVNSRRDYYKFKKWILGDDEEAYILCDYFYIITGQHNCFKCKKNTTVIGFGVENYFDVCDDEIYDTDDPFCYNSGEIHIASEIEGFSQGFYSYLKNTYNYFESFSNTLGMNCLANHCQHCNVIQGNFFVFQEVDSPFFIDSASKAANLVLHRIKLPFDIRVQMSLGFGSEDYLIKENAKIMELPLSLEI